VAGAPRGVTPRETAASSTTETASVATAKTASVPATTPVPTTASAETSTMATATTPVPATATAVPSTTAAMCHGKTTRRQDDHCRPQNNPSRRTCRFHDPPSFRLTMAAS